MTRFGMRRRAAIQLSHLFIVVTALACAFLLRFDFSLPDDQSRLLLSGLLIALPAKLSVFWLGGLHRGSWRYAGMADLVRLLAVNAIASALVATLALVLIGAAFPRSVYCIDFLLCFLLTAGTRFAIRLCIEPLRMERCRHGGRKVVIYGAGAAGVTLLRDILSNPALGYHVVGFLDDDANKVGLLTMGIPVLGRGRDAASIVDQCRKRGTPIEEIVIAMPSATGREMQQALANCRAAGVACKTIPGIGDLLAGKVLATQIRDMSISDLLGREPVQIEEDRIREHIAGRSVLVTGAAGSIGSELCRQVAGFEPSRLVALDQAESELFKVDLELRKACPNLDLVAEIADIRNFRRIDEVIRRHRIHAIFHAAAYKHVPLMESYPMEAIRNNVFGTRNLVQTAYQNGVSHFLMISSDKAVNPSSVMGATKRVAEMILSAMPTDRTRFVSVRFGNVLGSNGSAVPVFQSQIAAGGPVTITHPDMRRYFMTVREAVQLVLLASTMGRGSEIFVLDMGEPVRIVDLARQMIRLAGKTPDDEIEIRFVGMRAGEKLFEELTNGEDVLPTSHRKILVYRNGQVDRRVIERGLGDLVGLVDAGDVGGIILQLKQLIPTYEPDAMWARASESKARAAVG